MNIPIQEKLIIICAPSGAGKSTIAIALLNFFSNLAFSVSAVTREKREGEIEGKNYYFLSIKEFKQKIANEEFVEYEENYKNIFYGTLKSEIDRLHKENKVILFDVDVRGAESLKKIYGDNALVIFIKAPWEMLKERLISRGTDSPERIAERLEVAHKELQFEFTDVPDVVIENIDLDVAIKNAKNAVFHFMDIAA